MRKRTGKICIGYAVATLNFGGVEKYVVDIVNHIDRDRFKPIIFSFKSKGPLRERIRKDVEIVGFEKRQGNDPKLIANFSRHLKAWHVTILHSNNWSTFMESTLAGKMADVPVLIHAQHGIELNDKEATDQKVRWMRNRVRQCLAMFNHHIVTVSEANKRFVCDEWRVNPKKVKLILNGIDLSPFLYESKEVVADIGVNPECFVVGSVGRLMSVKNYPCLLKAFALLKAKDDHCKLLLIGDGPERLKIQRLCESLNISNDVKLLGNRTDIPMLLKALDVFVLPSFSEGISLALLEAMASRLPIIATDVGGNPEVVDNYKTGVLVESDNPIALAETLIKLKDDKEKRISLGDAAFQKIKTNFNIETMLRNYEKLYVDAIRQ